MLHLTNNKKEKEVKDYKPPPPKPKKNVGADFEISKDKSDIFNVIDLNMKK